MARSQRGTSTAFSWRDMALRRLMAVAALVVPLSSLLGAWQQPATGPSLTVIVRAAQGDGSGVAAEVTAAGGRVERVLSVVHGVLAEVPAGAVARLQRTPGIIDVSPDGAVQLAAAQTVYNPLSDTGSIYNTTLMTGAQAYWNAGYTGKGVDVAVIDSGAARVNGLSASGKVLDGPDLSFDSQAPNLHDQDGFGHGTHISGIIAGRDDAAVAGHYAGDSADFIGMAPDSRIISVKVADSNGITDVSQVLAAIDWVVQHHADPGLNIRVLNLSFGTDSYQSYLLDPLSYAVETAWHAGIVVVAATGNAGWKSSGVVDPSLNPYVIAVGAADTHGTNSLADDTVAGFSSVGDGSRNPDLVAPGIHMESLRVANSSIDAAYPGGVIDDRFFRGSGTSQATAVVSGAAALLLQQHPQLTPDQVKAMLTATAMPLAGQPATAQGAGELNLNNTLRATPPLLAVQLYVHSSGLGTLEGARGSVQLGWGGVQLQGEKDIFGHAVSTSLLASLLRSGSAWVGGVFNGLAWTGAGWVGSQWANTAWTSNSWSSNSWSSNSWSSNSWSSNSWSSNSWSSNSWSSNSWSSNSWSSAAWS
jgi:serine protease AprX